MKRETDSGLARAPLSVRHPRLVEAITSVVIVLSGIAGAINYCATGVPAAVAGVAVTLGGAALALRWPWPGLALTIVGPVLGALLGADPLVLWSMSVFAVLVATVRGLPALPAGVLTGAANYVAVVVHAGHGWMDSLAAMSFVVALAFALAGASLRSIQLYWTEVARRADEAVATREAEAERRVAEERLRIAHDLHDTLGHEIALVSMSVGAAEVHLATDPAEAGADLVRARERIQAVLKETQRVLTVLRDPADNTPVAGYGQIEHLVDQFRQAGLDTVASIAETPGEIDPEVSAAAYRIVQEALVNARKHGAGAVRLTVTADARSIDIEVTNRRGSADSPSSPGGYGLIGMRERAASAGGRIDVDEDDTRFTVRAALPTRGREDR